MSSWERPTFEELRSRIMADLQRSNGGNPFIKRSFEWALAWALTGTAHGQHGQLAAYARFLPTNCDADRLAEWGEMYGLPRKEPTPARRTATFNGVNGSLMEAGTAMQRNDGFRYRTLEDRVVADGAVNVDVEAELPGTDGNTDGPSPVQLVSPVSGVSSAGVFVAGGVDGTDVEDLEVWRARILQRVRNPPRGGATIDYEVWARATPGVNFRNVFVRPHRRGIGTVDVAFTVVGSDPIPSPGQVALVQAQIEEHRPQDMHSALVYAPIAQIQPYTIAVRPYTGAVRTAIEAAIAELHSREALMGERLIVSHVREAISTSPGELDHLLSVPSADVVPLSSDHIILPGAFTWSELPEP